MPSRPIAPSPDPLIVPNPLLRAHVALGPQTDPAAAAWAAHVAAGRIGRPAPPPPADGRDYRLAGLERILGLASRAGSPQ